MTEVQVYQKWLRYKQIDYFVNFNFQEIVHNHTYIATDYHEELSHWQDEDYSNENERVMQLTFTQVGNLVAILYEGRNQV